MIFLRAKKRPMLEPKNLRIALHIPPPFFFFSSICTSTNSTSLSLHDITDQWVRWGQDWRNPGGAVIVLQWSVLVVLVLWPFISSAMTTLTYRHNMATTYITGPWSDPTNTNKTRVLISNICNKRDTNDRVPQKKKDFTTFLFSGNF